LWFDKARSAVEAKGKVLQAVHRYKYNRALWLEGFLADLLVRAARQGLPSGCCDQIVPVPLFPTKQRERGFNQAERLARHLSKCLGVPLNSSAIRRVLPTPSQTHLGRLQRQENMNGAFATGAGDVTDARVVLVDDVFTTGATTNACACMLRKAGASAVYVWTLARGI
jgi:ComF family protein